MVTHNNEKTAMEREAVKLFIDLYNRKAESPLRLLYQQDRPDAVLEDAKHHKVGMEITHLFYDDKEAKELLGRSDGTPVDWRNERIGRIIYNLNGLISRKLEKKESYSEDYPISLLIRNASPVFGMADFLAHQERVKLSPGVFEHIWFVSRDGGEEWKLAEIRVGAKDRG